MSRKTCRVRGRRRTVGRHRTLLPLESSRRERSDSGLSRCVFFRSWSPAEGGSPGRSTFRTAFPGWPGSCSPKSVPTRPRICISRSAPSTMTESSFAIAGLRRAARFLSGEASAPSSGDLPARAGWTPSGSPSPTSRIRSKPAEWWSWCFQNLRPICATSTPPASSTSPGSRARTRASRIGSAIKSSMQLPAWWMWRRRNWTHISRPRNRCGSVWCVSPDSFKGRGTGSMCARCGFSMASSSARSRLRSFTCLPVRKVRFPDSASSPARWGRASMSPNAPFVRSTCPIPAR